jgi:hypothetical protein
MKDTLQSQQWMESGGTCPLLSKVGVSSILAQFKSYFGGATGSDVTGGHVTGNDIIGGHVTGSDRVRTCSRFPRCVLTIVVVQNVSLRMTGSSMATGCDVTEGQVTPKGFFGRMCACVTSGCAISALVGSFHP